MLSFALLPALALADIPPGDGYKSVRFGVRVENAAAYPSHRFIVYPWSASNGVPMAEVGRVPADQPLYFGRRIRGESELWAIPADTPDEALRTADASGEPPADENAPPFPAFVKATRCAGPIETTHEVADAGPDEIVQVWRVEKLDDTGCVALLTTAAPMNPPAAVKVAEVADSWACATAPIAGGAATLVGAALLLVANRRRTP